MLGYAVIDTETTGLHIRKNDRVIEIAVVLMDADLNITGKYETVLNPHRDLGKVSIHGINGLIASKGASFHDVMASLSVLLRDRIIVGHNVNFDIKMLAVEYELENVYFDAGEPLDTLKIARKLNLPTANNKLGTLCEHFGIPLVNAHSAMDDTVATAELFKVLFKKNRKMFRSSNFSPARVSSRQHDTNFRYWVERNAIMQTNARPITMSRYISRLPGRDQDLSDETMETYLKSMHLTFLNSNVSYFERDAMERLISSLKLNRNNTVDLNEEYIFMLICKNLHENGGKWRTTSITDKMKVISDFTGINDDKVNDLITETQRQSNLIKPITKKLHSYFSLSSGDVFSITGEDLQIDKSQWINNLTRKGLVSKESPTRATKLVIASDPYSLSAKAVKARDYGIPVIREDIMIQLTGIANK